MELINRFFRTAKDLAIVFGPARRAAACFLLGEANLISAGCFQPGNEDAYTAGFG